MTAVALVAGQVGYAVTEFWRARIVLLFSVVTPLVWLVFIGAMTGNGVADPATGLRVMQFATPLAIAMGTLYAILPTTAITITEAREHGVLKRLRGTPLPMWAYLSGRALGAAAYTVVSIGVSLVVGVVVYDVQVVWRTAGATVVTLLLGMACFVALGLAISVLCPSTTIAQGVAIGGVVALSFISGLFMPGASFPTPVVWVADVLPVKAFTQTLQDLFNPYLAGAGWDLVTLALLAAWTVVGMAVAIVFLRRQDVGAVPSRAGGAGSEVVPRTPGRVSLPAVVVSRPTASTKVAGQVSAVLRATRRDLGALFFAVVMPVGLFALINSTVEGFPAPEGVSQAEQTAAGMITWGVAVTAFMNVPESVVRSRDRGVLKRLRGTPLAPVHYVIGRAVGALALSLLVAALVVVLGCVAYGLRPPLLGLLGAVGVLVLGTGSLISAGFLLAAAVRNSRAYGAVAIVVLLPVSFVSDVFGPAGPNWMVALGSAFPVKHLQNALSDLFAGVVSSSTWVHVSVLALWTILAGLLAVRVFRWSPAQG